jgi:hypothetical protein
MIKLLLLFVAILLFTSVNAQPIEVTTADGYGADTYLSNDEQRDWTSPDSCHGDEATMKLRNLPGVRLKIPYLRFDISSIKSPGVEIDSAKIVLWPSAYKGDPFPILYIYALTGDYADDWDEMTTCFNSAPGVMPSMPFGYFELYDMVLVDNMIVDVDEVAPGSDWRDGIAYFQSEGGDALDDFINNIDTDGLLTFAFIGDTTINHDFDIASKEDTITHIPKLIFKTVATGIDGEKESIITEYKLNQNYPNPFNPATNIEFTLTKPGYTTLEIYNTLGQPVATLIDGLMSSGHHQITFTADGYTSGIYFYKLTSGNFTQVKKMMLLK